MSSLCFQLTWAFLISSSVALLIGGLVGLAEILSRYRDDPFLAAKTRSGVWYCVLNGVAGVLVFWLLLLYDTLPSGLEGHDFPSLLKGAAYAGLGAMILLRSRLFKVERRGGEAVSIGPDFILDTIFKTLDTYIDKSRALYRTQLAATLLADSDSRQLTILIPGLIKKSRQNLTAEEERELGRILSEISASDQSQVVKNFELSLLLIDYLGEGYVRAHQKTLVELSKTPPLTANDEVAEEIEIE